MQQIVQLATSLAALGAAITLAEGLLPEGGTGQTARVCVGLLYIAAVMEQITGIFLRGGI
ncbi:MAG: hypothetical protein FWE69_08140 [Clostridiales bacterium]|nr:hypothetical protein [Clostridiales bacterium]